MTSNNGTEIRVLAATGVCGSGFRVSSLAEVVLAGRSSDCAIFAGIPVQAGIPAGIAWHAAKIRECGAASATIIRHQAIHLSIPAWSGLITGVTCPYHPSYLERGTVYRFCVNHVVEPDDPYEMFPIEHLQVH